MAPKRPRKSAYDRVRDKNIREIREKFREAFRVELADGSVREPWADPPTPPPRQVARRSRRSGPKLNRQPVRRSTRLCYSKYASKKKPGGGFLGFPPSVFLRITKYKGKPLEVERVVDESQLPEATEDLEFTLFTIAPVSLDLIPAEYASPEMFGNGWKDGIELDSDDEVEDVTTATLHQDDSIGEDEPRRAKRRKLSNSVTNFPILSVEDVTPDLLKGVCYSARKNKIGVCSTCHQCRQKTSDTKSICRSGKCRGLRGMFCGFCLKRRYGEDVSVVLLDPNWECPPCRNLCNCSICRSRANLPPTGILYPEATQRGFACVSDYLSEIERD